MLVPGRSALLIDQVVPLVVTARPLSTLVTPLFRLVIQYAMFITWTLSEAVPLKTGAMERLPALGEVMATVGLVVSEIGPKLVVKLAVTTRLDSMMKLSVVLVPAMLEPSSQLASLHG